MATNIAGVLDAIRRAQPGATKPVVARAAQLGVLAQTGLGRIGQVFPGGSPGGVKHAPANNWQGFPSQPGRNRAPHPTAHSTVGTINRGMDSVQAPIRVNP